MTYCTASGLCLQFFTLLSLAHDSAGCLAGSGVPSLAHVTIDSVRSGELEQEMLARGVPRSDLPHLRENCTLRARPSVVRGQPYAGRACNQPVISLI
ncbi:hypothetical protein EJ03DRAFT_329704 [Teratosphaeria nubilosa]|uniref:Secreted protein n=1 Tax=Teratosphaeria nubilosa TaxID=161662 RepID=A0A6G1L1L2_9PEZI|nr:hypothetical protein EJ03DRAFT_329704 [Teratosphaeria nubilosa]